MIEQLQWGLQITVVGMGLVFALLAMLWALLALVLRFDRDPEAKAPGAVTASPSAVGVAGPAEASVMLAAEAVPQNPADSVTEGAALPKPGVTAESGGPGNGLDRDLLAAITIAVVTHRALRRRQAAPAMRSYWPGSLLYASRWVGTGRARQNFYWRRRGK